MKPKGGTDEKTSQSTAPPPNLDDVNERMPDNVPIKPPTSPTKKSQEFDLDKKDEIDFSKYDTNRPGFQVVVDESYQLFNSESDFQIFCTHITSEIPLQRLVAAKSLGTVCSRFGLAATLDAVIPKLNVVATDKEMVIRQTTADQLGHFCENMCKASNETAEKTVKGSDPQKEVHNVIVSEILPFIQAMLLDALEVRQAAGRSLVTIAKLLTQDEVFEHVLKIVLHMAHDDSDDHKITALPLIGELAPTCGPTVCLNYLTQDLNALSQDNSFRVRKATVQYFGPICEQVGPSHTEKTLLPIFMTLTKDAIWSVRKGCVESLVDISKAVTVQKRTELVEVMMQFLQDNSRWVRNAAYEVLGPFIATLSTDQISDEFLQFYTSIPTLKSSEADTESSNHCAFNFPAVVLTLGAERWPALHDTYNVLVRKTFKTRKTLACSLHELAKILGTDITEKELTAPLDIFLKDIDDIRDGVVRNFAQFLKVMSPEKREEHLATLWELASESDTNWRFRLLLATQLETLVFLYPPNVISEQLVPLAFQLCDDKMADVRHEAVKSIGHIMAMLKENGTPEQLQDVLQKVHMLYANRTYTKRQLYIHLCGYCLDVIDEGTFKSHLLDSFTELRNDPISNVRLSLAKCISENFQSHPTWSKHPDIITSMKTLRDDPEDVDVARYFRTTAEVQDYLRVQREKRQLQEEMELDNILKSDDDSDTDATGNTASSTTSSSEYHDIASGRSPKDSAKDQSTDADAPAKKNTKSDNTGAGNTLPEDPKKADSKDDAAKEKPPDT